MNDSDGTFVCTTCISKKGNSDVMKEVEAVLHKDVNLDHRVISIEEEANVASEPVL